MSKAKRTKCLEIPMKVKRIVAERDSVDGHPCCIWCGKPAPTTNPLAYSNAHYIPRSRGGLGIERNTLTLDWDCHMRYDQTEHQEEMKEKFREHLMSCYPDWDEGALVYKK